MWWQVILGLVVPKYVFAYYQDTLEPSTHTDGDQPTVQKKQSDTQNASMSAW